MNEFQKTVMAVIKASFVDNTSIAIPEDFDWDEILSIGENHQITPMLYYGLTRSGTPIPENISDSFKGSTFGCIIRDDRQWNEIKRVLDAFEKNGIDHLPLKGTDIKALYPKPEYRLMSDADILIREEQYGQIREIMTGLGFIGEKKSPHEYIWIKSGILYLELHYQLFPDGNTDFVRYYGNGWDKAHPCDGSSCRYTMSDEDTYIYIITHFAKHYRDGGIGLKQLTDMWIFKNTKPNMDDSYINNALKQLHLLDFYGNILKATELCFGDASPTNITDIIINRIFISGVTGSSDELSAASGAYGAESQAQYKNARWRWLGRAAFPSFEIMSEKYAVLKKLPFLLPIMWAVRLANLLMHKKDKVRSAKSTFELLSPEFLESRQKEFHAVGLNLAFENDDNDK